MNPIGNGEGQPGFPNPSSPPSSEMLAAYCDGELEGRDDLVKLKAQIERWLEDHPETRAELAEMRRQRYLWQTTTPTDPSAAAWDRVWSGIQRELDKPADSPGKWRWAYLGGIAACVLFGLVVYLYFPTTPSLPIAGALEDEVFEVAVESEVTIVRVDGQDTQTLVVGELPVKGPLELAAPGEVTLTKVQPDPTDNMVPAVRFNGQSAPLVWARLETEEE